MTQAFDNLKKLAGAGKGKDARSFLQDQASGTSRAYAAIREDRTLSEEGKTQRLAGVYCQMKTSIDRELQQRADRVVNTDRDDASRVFGIAGLSGDVASLTISRRDAADRVEKIESAVELRALLARATRAGDEVLARAVAERALESMDDTTMNQFLEDRPDLDQAANRLWDAAKAEHDSMGHVVLLADLKPHELMFSSDDQIRAIADAEPSEPVRQAAAQPFAYGGDPL